jgi:hypothetical protein
MEIPVAFFIAAGKSAATIGGTLFPANSVSVVIWKQIRRKKLA